MKEEFFNGKRTCEELTQLFLRSRKRGVMPPNKLDDAVGLGVTAKEDFNLVGVAQIVEST